MDSASKKKDILKKRGIAFAIDYFLIMIVHKSIMLAFTGFITTYFFHLPKDILQKAMYEANMASLPISLIIFWGYFTLSYYLGNGQTPGKLFLGLRVYGEDNYPTLKEAFMRTLGYFCCFLTLSVLFTIPYFTRSKKGIPDWLSGTFVDYDDYIPEKDLKELTPIDQQAELFPKEEYQEKSA